MKVPALFLVCLLCAAVTAALLVQRLGPPWTESASGAEEGKPVLVLAGHSATYSLSAALAEGTAIEVVWAWPAGVTWDDQQDAAPIARAAQARAAVTMRAAVPSDALYGAVRARNFSAIEVDATASEDLRAAALSTVKNAATSPAPAVALTAANAMRMATTLARELGRLSPADAARIQINLQQVKERIFRALASAQGRVAAAEEPEVRLISPVFAPLLEELGVRVLPADDASVRLAVSAGERIGRRGDVVYLDALSGAPADPGHYFAVLEKNRDALIEAMAGASVPAASTEE
jgi:ABC-type Zn uptake system ZnuABC Zn-binding protein ZnuA